MKKIKDFFKTRTGQHIYSFTKTYVTVFIGIYLTLHNLTGDENLKAMIDLNLIDIDILAVSAKGALVSVLRNVYKQLTEK